MVARSIVRLSNVKGPQMLELNVADMTCGHCASTITRAVKEVDSAALCEVDLRQKTVRVKSDKPATEFVEAIQEAGYSPQLRSATGS